MQIPGHLAVAIAQHYLIAGPRQDSVVLKPLLLASLFPDIVDKSLGYVFHVMPNGRHYAHNIFSLTLLSLAVTLIWGKRVGYSWFIGYLGHLLADLSAQSRVPWFFPVKSYTFKQGQLRFESSQIFKEIIFLVLVILVCTRTVK